jgi:dienelactone hydrolase
MRRLAAVWSFVLICGASTGCGGPPPHAAITVRPANGLIDRARSIRITGLAPNELITVTATSLRPDGRWGSSARFRVPGSGTLDLGERAPLAGSYRSASAMGLFWSQRLLAPAAVAAARRTVVTTLTASAHGRRLASTRVSQQVAPPSVDDRPISVPGQGFAGEYFGHAPRDPGPGPGVVVWGGSEGGLGDGANEAALLAAHGIPALALAYFDEPGLPCNLESIPIEYFIRAIQWLRAQPDVDPRRVWIEAESRGTEPALLLAAARPDLVHGVIAASPGAVVGGSNAGTCPTVGGTAWTLGGAPVPAGQPLPVQEIRGPVMLITGGDDQLESSQADADQILAALPHGGGAHVHLHYPGAGPAVLGIPYAPIPMTRLEYGGTIAANAAAYASAWPASVAFVEQH